MAYADHVTPREAVRAALKDRFRDLVNGAVQRVDVTQMTTDELGPDEQALPLWDKVPVITLKDFEAAFWVTFDEPLPAPSAKTAEVATPATVFVAAECPRCHISQRMPLAVTVELHQDSDGETLHLKAKSKETVHTCGQLPLPEREEEAAGQEELPFEEGEEEPAEEEAEEAEAPGLRLLGAGEVVEAEFTEASALCANAACVLEADHAGACRSEAETAVADEPESDLLPA